MATSQQVLSALRIHNLFNILNGSAPINHSQYDDITDWSSLNISTNNGDTVEIITQMIAPTNIACYENTGFANNDFGSPDMDLTSLTSPSFNLPVYTGGSIPVYGTYVLNIKVKVTLNGASPFYVDKSFNFELANKITPTLKLSETWNCTVATYRSEDVSEYCSDGCGSGYTLTNVTKTHTVYPPDLSGQSSVTASSTIIALASPTNPLWTGTYEAKLSSVITYEKGDCEIITHASTSTEAKVICDDVLCGLYCQMKKLYNEFKANLGINTTVANKYQAMLTKGQFAYQLAVQARLCSDEATVEKYVADFYSFTGTDPNCSCCKDQPSPVIPTSIINGTDGMDGETPQFRVTGTIFQTKLPSESGWTTLYDFSDIAGLDGTSFLQGVGSPSIGLGSNGDSYLNISNGDIYLKSAGSWSVTGNLKGVNGVGLLVNEYTQVATTTSGSNEILKTYTFGANTFASNGTMVEVEAVYKRLLNNGSTSGGSIKIGGETRSVYLVYGFSNYTDLKVSMKLTRISSTVLKMELFQYFLASENIVDAYVRIASLSTVYDFTTTIELDVLVNDATIGTTGVSEFRITKYNI